MMGISLANILTAYLYENGYLSLPGIGRFDVSGGEDLSDPEKVEFTEIPSDLIQFKYNSKESTDPELVKYITVHTRKMQSLAAADLSSFTDQAVQMLNLLQPVSFPGIGTISRGTKGIVTFETGRYMTDLLKEPESTSHRAKRKNSSTATDRSRSTATTSAKDKPTRTIGGMLIILVCILIAAVLIYFIFSNKDNEAEVTGIEKKDSTIVEKKDTLKDEKEQKWTTAPPKGKGVIQYQVVFAHSVDSEYAFWRDSQLTEYGHTIIMTKSGLGHYDLAVPVTSLVSDTTWVKDSLQIFYGSSTTIRYKTGD